MLDNFLDKSKPINFIVLLGLFLLSFSFVSYSVFFDADFRFEKLLELSLVLILFISIFFFYNFIITKNNLTFDNSYAYFVFTLFVICLLFSLLEINFLIIILIHFLLLRKVYSFHSTKNIIQKLFDSGFWLGVSFILEPYTILYFTVVYGAIYLHQKITIHTLLTPIIGLLSPLLIYFTYCFWYNKTEEFTNLLFNLDFFVSIQTYLNSKSGVFLLVILVLSLIPFFAKTPKTLSVNNTFKRSWILISFHLLISLLFILFINNKNGSEIIFLLFPATVIIANGLELIKQKSIKNVILYSFIIGVFVFSFVL